MRAKVAATPLWQWCEWQETLPVTKHGRDELYPASDSRTINWCDLLLTLKASKYPLPHTDLSEHRLSPYRVHHCDINMTSPVASFYDLKPLDSKKQPFGFDNLRGKVVLVVNVASK